MFAHKRDKDNHAKDHRDVYSSKGANLRLRGGGARDDDLIRAKAEAAAKARAARRAEESEARRGAPCGRPSARRSTGLTAAGT